MYPFRYHDFPRKRVFLVDTSGFDDSTRSDAEILRELSAWLTATYAKNIRLSGIIYLHRINQPRMRGSAKRNIMMFKKLCGDNALKNVILATTMWDLVGEDVGAARVKQLIDTKDFWGYMASNGSQVYRHNNTYQSAMELVGHFIKADSKVTLQIQEEMVSQQKGLDGTAAAAIIEAKLEQEWARFSAELHHIEIDLQEALRKKNNDTMELLREIQTELQTELAQIKESQRSLRTSIERLYEESHSRSTVAEASKTYDFNQQPIPALNRPEAIPDILESIRKTSLKKRGLKKSRFQPISQTSLEGAFENTRRPFWLRTIYKTG
jgi:hypothetical protein